MQIEHAIATHKFLLQFRCATHQQSNQFELQVPIDSTTKQLTFSKRFKSLSKSKKKKLNVDSQEIGFAKYIYLMLIVKN
jgi:hypothetical protein